MSIMNFTVEETNMIAIYKEKTQRATLFNIAGAYPDMDRDMRLIAESAYNKLAELNGPDFDALTFALADETGG